MTPVDSSNLEAIAAVGDDLWIRFRKTGALYRYPGAASWYWIITQAESPGSAFELFIRSDINQPYEWWE